MANLKFPSINILYSKLRAACKPQCNFEKAKHCIVLFEHGSSMDELRKFLTVALANECSVYSRRVPGITQYFHSLLVATGVTATVFNVSPEHRLSQFLKGHYSDSLKVAIDCLNTSLFSVSSRTSVAAPSNSQVVFHVKGIWWKTVPTELLLKRP